MAGHVSRSLRCLAVAGAVASVFAGMPPALAAPGNLDHSFNGSGQRITTLGPTGSFAEAHAVAVRDGRIVAVGSVGPSDFTDADMAVARYTSDGHLDTTFSGDGKLRLDIGGEYDDLWGVAVLPSGKILAAGSSTANGKSFFAVIRLKPNGRLDHSFGAGDGKVFLSFGPGDSFGQALRVLPSGKFLVSGDHQTGPSGSRMALARFLPAGGLDFDFGGGDGRVITGFPQDLIHTTTSGMVVMPDGRIILVGGTGPSSQDADLALVRFRPNGTLDPTFGGDGRVRKDLSGDHFGDVGTGVALAGGGKVVVGAYVVTSGNRMFGVARFKQGGGVDTTFGGGDGVVLTGLGVNVAPRGFARQPDGKLLGVGEVDGPPQDRMVVVRWKPGGAIDTGFGGGDGVADPFFPPGESVAYGTVVQPNGKIVIAGNAAANGTTHGFGLERFLG
jgi:uncharacterized delta-60 repeat protein